jgi:hypothetical protein
MEWIAVMCVRQVAEENSLVEEAKKMGEAKTPIFFTPESMIHVTTPEVRHGTSHSR